MILYNVNCLEAECVYMYDPQRSVFVLLSYQMPDAAIVCIMWVNIVREGEDVAWLPYIITCINKVRFGVGIGGCSAAPAEPFTSVWTLETGVQILSSL